MSEVPLEVARTFRRLAAEWIGDTAPLSSIRRKLMHPSYEAITKMGEPVIPHILAELVTRPSHLFWALSDITGEKPEGYERAENFHEVIDCWVSWGKHRGYLP